MSAGTGAGPPAPVTAAMGWNLAPEVSFCDAGERFVFLDLARDRYFCLPAAIDAQTRVWIAQQGQTPPPALINAGLVVEAYAPAAPIAACTVATAPNELAVPAAGASAPTIARAALSTTTARLSLRMCPLVRVLRGLATTGGPPRADLHAACASFRTARKTLPIASNCLPDSIALLRFLGRTGARPQLVFGVTMDPFRAHCWVQDATHVLNDELDTVSRFVPIRAL